ncbi:MAG: hypothetical protein AB7H88_14840 [Vicinamibacterales bacterium]
MRHQAIPDSLAGHLAAALAPFKVEGLLSPGARRRIDEQIASRLPARLTGLYGFECRLWDPAPEGDFLVCAGRDAGEWPVLRALALDHAGDGWRRLADFLRGDGATAAPAHSEITNMWLEFDVVEGPDPGGDLPPPSLFFGSRQLEASEVPASGDLPPGAAWLAQAIGALRGVVPSPGQRRALARCLGALPPEGCLFQIGVMLSRPDAFVRVCASELAVDEIAPYLAAIGWPGDMAALAAMLDRLGPLVDEVRIDLDIDDDLRAPIGLECYIKAGPDLPSRMVAFLQALIADGLCLPAKASGLLAWFGLTHERLYPDRWPPALLAKKALLGLAESSVFHRWVHHVKIQLSPGAPPRAKGYLAVAPAFVSDAEIRKVLQQGAGT